MRIRRPLRAALLFELSLGLLAAVLGALLSLPPPLPVRPVGLLLGVVATLPLLLPLGLFVTISWPPVRRMRELLDRLLDAIAPELTLPATLLLAAAAGVGEELLFRWFLQGALAELLPPVVSLVLTAVVFGLLHAVTPLYALYATLLGGYLGTLYYLTGSLLAVVTVHTLYDALGLLLLRRRFGGGESR